MNPALSLHIGYDAKRAFSNFTGLGAYSRSVIELMSRYAPENRYSLYTPCDKQLFTPPKEARVCSPRSSGKWAGSYWRTYRLARLAYRDGVQVFHGLSHELPVGVDKFPLKTVLTVHDLIFYRFPQWYNPIDVRIYCKKLHYACRVADRIVAITEMTKRDLCSYLQVSEDKIEVIYQDTAPRFRKKMTRETVERIRAQYHLPKDFILSVGTIERRKNLVGVLRALALLKVDIPLVVVGRPTRYFKEVMKVVRQHALQRRVLFLGYIPQEELPALYRAATFFAFVSFFEGMGLPIVEALHCETPVVTSTGSCFYEAGGEGALYANPHSSEDIASCFTRLAEDGALRASLAANGQEHVKKFSEQIQVDRFKQLYKSLL